MSKKKVLKHLNEILGLSIPLDIKIKVVKDVNELVVGAFRWIIIEGEYEHILGSQYTLKDLATMIEHGHKLIIIKTNTHYLDVISGTSNLECLEEVSHLIYNPNGMSINYHD